MVTTTIKQLRALGLGDEEEITLVVVDAAGGPVEVRNNWIVAQRMQKYDDGSTEPAGGKRCVLHVNLPAVEADVAALPSPVPAPRNALFLGCGCEHCETVADEA